MRIAHSNLMKKFTVVNKELKNLTLVNLILLDTVCYVFRKTHI